MLSIFTWPAEPEDSRKPTGHAAERSPERPRGYEAQLARSHAEMRARRPQPA